MNANQRQIFEAMIATDTDGDLITNDGRTDAEIYAELRANPQEPFYVEKWGEWAASIDGEMYTAYGKLRADVEIMVCEYRERKARNSRN